MQFDDENLSDNMIERPNSVLKMTHWKEKNLNWSIDLNFFYTPGCEVGVSLVFCTLDP